MEDKLERIANRFQNLKTWVIVTLVASILAIGGQLVILYMMIDVLVFSITRSR